MRSCKESATHFFYVIVSLGSLPSIAANPLVAQSANSVVRLAK